METTAEESFFNEIYDLDEPDDSTGDVDALLTALRDCRPQHAHSRSSHRLIHTSRQTWPLERTVSAPLATTTDMPKASLTRPLHKFNVSHSGTAAATVSHSPPLEASCIQARADVDYQSNKEISKMPSASVRKRKRGQSLEVLPEAQQIFRGLRFCLLPRTLEENAR